MLVKAFHSSRNLLLSLLVHLLLLGLAVVAFDLDLRSPTQLPFRPRVTQIEVVPSDRPATRKSNGAQSKSKNPSPNSASPTAPTPNSASPTAPIPNSTTANSPNPNSAKNSLPLSRLGVGMPAAKGTGTGSTQASSQTSSEMPWAEEGLWQPFLQALYNRIDQTLDYPDALIDARKTGEVTIEFKVNQHGQLVGSAMKVMATDPYLKVHVLRKLMRALEEPLDGHFKNPEETMSIVAQFEFVVTGRSDTLPPRLMKRLRNLLKFRRYAIRSRAATFESLADDQVTYNPNTGSRNANFNGAYRLDDRGIFAIGAGLDSSGTQAGVGIGINFVPIIQWIFEKPKVKIDPLERYKEDPNF